MGIVKNEDEEKIFSIFLFFILAAGVLGGYGNIRILNNVYNFCFRKNRIYV